MSSWQPVRGRRRGPGWVRVGHGLYRPADIGDSAPFLADLRTWQLAVPEPGRFTHLTAAAAHGLWMPPLPAGMPVLVALPRAASRPGHREIRAIRQSRLLPPEAVSDAPGLRLDPVPQLLLACAHDLGLLDLVVLIDSALHRGLCTRAELEEASGPRRKGAPRLREALLRADARSESAWETLLRILHRCTGIEVEPQGVVVDEHGAFVARGDLLLVGTRTLHEYDGGDHLERRQQRKDLKRHRRLVNDAYVRRGYTVHDVLHQAVGIVRDADLAVGRPHDSSRIRPWHKLLRESLLTPAGQHRLLHRWGLLDEKWRDTAG